MSTDDDTKLARVKKAINAGTCRCCPFRIGCDLRNCIIFISDKLGLNKRTVSKLDGKSFKVLFKDSSELVIHAHRVVECSNGDTYYLCSDVRTMSNIEKLPRCDVYAVNKLVYNENLVVCETAEGRCRPHKITMDRRELYPLSCEVIEGEPTPQPVAKDVDTCPHCQYSAKIGHGKEAFLVVRHQDKHNHYVPARAVRKWNEESDPERFDDGTRSDFHALLACPKCRKAFLTWKFVQ